MKPFNFIATKNIISEGNKYKSLQKQRNKDGSNKKMLQMYGQMQLDPKMQAYCNNLIEAFRQYSINHSSHQLFKSQNSRQYESLKHLRNVSLLSSKNNDDVNIKALRMKLEKFPSYKSVPVNENVKSTYIQGQKPVIKLSNIIPRASSKRKQQKIKPKQPKQTGKKQEIVRKVSMKIKYNTLPLSQQVHKKFRRNIKLIQTKMKNMNLTMNEIIKFNLFAKDSPPYQFGRKIFKAIKENRQDLVWRETIQNRYSIFTRDFTKKTPVIWASIRGYAQILQLLLKSGAPVDFVDDLGNSAIHYSIKYGHQQCTRILVLYLGDIKEQEIYMAQDKSSKIKSIIFFWKNYSKILKGMNIEKRKGFFFEQEKYHTIKKL